MVNFDSLRDAVLRDGSHALRSWARAPALVVGAIGTIGIGIAALVSVFILVNGALLRPLPFPGADRLVVLVNAFRGQPSQAPLVSAPRARAWQRSSRAIEEVTLYSIASLVGVSGRGELQVARATQVSATFFPFFGARAIRGRTFTAVEDQPGAPFVVVLSHGFWMREFGGGDDAVGRSLLVNGTPAMVLGVLDAAFDARSLTPVLGAPPDLWLPLRLDPITREDANTLVAVGRLDAAVSLEVAREEARAAAEAFREEFPGELPAEGSFALVLLAEAVAGDLRQALLLLLAAASLAALLILVNVTNLFIARASARRREFAVRLALGGTRARLAGHAITESLALAVTGGVLGTAAGLAIVRGLVASELVRVPRVGEIGVADAIDVRLMLLVGTAIVTIAMALAALPVATSVGSAAALEQDLRLGPRVTGRTRRTQSALIAIEVALACVVVVGAALLVRTMTRLRQVDPGVGRSGVWTLQTSSGDVRLGSAQGATLIFEQGLRRLSALPGVDSAAVTLTGVPLQQGGALRVDVVGQPSDRQFMASWDLASPRYFDVLGIRLLSGRLLDERDGPRAAPVAVVNETMARRLWPDDSPLGQHIVIGRGGGPAFDEGVVREVVGIVSDVRQFGLTAAALPGTYVPLAQMPDAQMAFFNRLAAPASWLVRTVSTGGPAAAVLQRELVGAIGLPATNVRSMDDVFTESIAPAATHAWMMSTLGGLSVLVAMLGVYALCAHAVERRTHELAVRVALGASGRQVRHMVVRHTLRAVMWGLGAGLVSAAALSTLLSSLLFGIGPHDWLAFTVVPVGLALTAASAAWMSTRGAALVDPVIALRE